MRSLLTRVQSRLHHHRSEDDGGTRPPGTPHCPRWLAAAIGVAVILIAAVTVAISLTSADNDELASAGTTEATSTSTSDPTSQTTSTTGTDSTTDTTAPRTASAAQATTPAPVPSAATDLTAFFAAADRVDRRLEAAADQYNQSIGPDTVDVDAATSEAVRSIDPHEAAAAIPPGLPPDLLLEVLIVQDDLTSRTAALEGAVEYVHDGATADALICLENGKVKAARFDSDVAAAKALARSTPPIAVAAPDSRAAGELALRLSVVHGHNYGCGACGGQLTATRLEPITWYDEPTADPATGYVFNGTVDLGGGPVRFTADYTPGQGWKAQLNAC